MDIVEGDVTAGFALYQRIPEFETEAHIDALEFERRLSRPGASVLVGVVDGSRVGFKAGYDRYRDGSWYSWLGGVLPEHRGRGVAEALLAHQEAWVRDKGYRSIVVRTRNRFRSMRALLARCGYDVIGVEAPAPDTPRDQLRIIFTKTL